MTHGGVIATTWITFLAAAASTILLAIAGSIQMKPAPLSDSDQAKMKQLGMAGFWVLVMALIFGLIAAIWASCMHPSLGKFLRTVQDRLATSDLAQRLRTARAAPALAELAAVAAESQ